MGIRRVLDRIGTVGIVIGMFAAGGLVFWNLWGQGPYADSCTYSLGCRSFYCLHHGLRGGSAQVTAPGTCTKACDADADCGSGASCVTLDDNSRDDLPPFGKPDKACMRAYEIQGVDTTRH